MTTPGTAVVLCGDARQLPLADASVDAIVCDPPYGLEFMGKEWDSFKPAAARLRTRLDQRTNPTDGKSMTTTPEAYVAGAPFQRWCEQWAREALRVLKPGGHLLAFGGSRTWHRLTCAIEDAGFDLRDSIAWLYGSGFPKSLDVSKAIDKAAGATREVVGRYVPPNGKAWNLANDTAPTGYKPDLGSRSSSMDITAPATDDARRWAGWGTALKPAFEPIVVARKPLDGTVAGNVLAYGTGALNIDACRVPASDKAKFPTGYSKATGAAYAQDEYSKSWTCGEDMNPDGRWPTNVVLSHLPLLDERGEVIGDACADGCVPGCPVAELDAQSGVLTSGANPTRRNGSKFGDTYGEFAGGVEIPTRSADSGGASRFFPTFRYEAKAPADERPRVNGVAHPTVKPLELIRWLCRLVTPPGGLVLDMFAGSGTTVEAALLEGFRVIGIERDADYLPLIAYRVDRARRRLQPGVARLAKTKPAAQTDGQGDLFADLFGGAA